MTIARATALFPILLSSVAVAQTATPAAPAPTAPAPAQPPRCAGAEHRQFDFWVGRWDVFVTGTEQRVGSNHIESLYNGCVIRENWAPLVGPGGPGGSLNSWLPRERKWRQTWVDSSNSYVVFEGGMEGEAMVLTGTWPGAAGPGTTPLIRMRYTREAGGAVRQLGEQSTDQGRTWAPNFDLTYRPAQTAN